MNNEIPDEIWVSDGKGTGNCGVWSRYETPHIAAGRSGKITKSTRKTRFPRFKYIRADKAVPDGWRLVPIEPTDEMAEDADWDFHDEWSKQRESSMKKYNCLALSSEGFSRRIYKAMLSAAPQPPIQTTGWQPIENAPKDGTHILAWNYESRFNLPPYICWFGQDMNEHDENKREWLTGDGDDWSTGYYYTPCKPTHWMPLPQPPKEGD